MLKNLVIRLKLLSRSPYILAALYIMEKLGFKYVNELVYERPLNTEIGALNTKIPVEVRALSMEDVKNDLFECIRLASGDDPVQHNEALGRICNGGKCYVAVTDGKVAGFAWLNFLKRKYEPAIERVETFRDDEALIYDTFVLFEFRGKGVGSKLNEVCLQCLRSYGYKRSLVYINSNNIPSINSFENVGFRMTKAIKYFKILNFRKTVVYHELDGETK